MHERSKGLHLIVDAIATRRLDDGVAIRKCILAIVEICGMRLRHIYQEAFANGSDFGHGITAVGILCESNIIIHTSPNYRMLNVDIYSCKLFDTDLALATLIDVFGIEDVKQVRKVQRY